MSSFHARMFLRYKQRRADSRRHSVEELLRGLLFGRQLDFLDDEGPTRVLLCGRRAGKSWVIAVWLLLQAMRPECAEPDVWCVYIALTRINAKRYFWPILKRVVAASGIEADFLEGELICSIRGGGRILLGGCEDVAAIQRWRGPKLGAAAVDECGAFPDYLEDLLGEAIEPGLADLDGPLVLAGTPGQILRGYWFDISGPERSSAIPLFHWTMFENPHMPTAQAYAKRILEQRGWTTETPQYQREYGGRWSQGTEMLVYPFDIERNQVAELPFRLDDPGWRFVISIDPGQVDACGITVEAAHKNSPYEFTLCSEKESGLLSHQVAQKVRQKMDSYKNAIVVMDTGGMGKQHAAEITRRFGIPVIAADKRDRRSNINLAHDRMLSGRAKILAGPQNDAIRGEMSVIQWNEDRTDHNKSQKDPKTGKKEDHCVDARMYGQKYLRHYAWKEQEKKPRMGTREYYMAEEERLMKQAEREYRRANR